jgi:hypothetical protein
MSDFFQTEALVAKPYARRDLLASVCALALMTLSPSVSRAESGRQEKWAGCAKCRTIFFDGSANKGHCAAGGAHTSSTTRVQLNFNVPEGPRMQGGWRFCNKCNALFFNGDARNKGVCPGGAGHQAQGLDFVLPHDLAGPQLPYRFCAKCSAMFVLGQGGRCPAGEEHAAAGFHFALEREGERPLD